MTSTTTQTLTSQNHTVGSLDLRGSTQPIPRNHSLDVYPSHEVTTVIGHEFSSELQLSKIIHADDADELIKDMAVLGRSHLICSDRC